MAADVLSMGTARRYFLKAIRRLAAVDARAAERLRAFTVGWSESQRRLADDVLAEAARQCDQS